MLVGDHQFLPPLILFLEILPFLHILHLKSVSLLSHLYVLIAHFYHVGQPSVNQILFLLQLILNIVREHCIFLRHFWSHHTFLAEFLLNCFLVLFLNIFLLLYDLGLFHSQLIDDFTLTVKLTNYILLFELVQFISMLVPKIAKMINSVAFTRHGSRHPPIQLFFIALQLRHGLNMLFSLLDILISPQNLLRVEFIFARLKRGHGLLPVFLMAWLDHVFAIDDHFAVVVVCFILNLWRFLGHLLLAFIHTLIIGCL